MKLFIPLICLFSISLAEPPVGDGYPAARSGHDHDHKHSHGEDFQRSLSNEYGAPAFNSRSLATEYGSPAFGARSLSTEYGAPTARISQQYGPPSQRSLSQEYGAPLARNSLSTEYGAPRNAISQEYGAPSLRNLPEISQEYGPPSARGLSQEYGVPAARDLSQEYGAPAAKSIADSYLPSSRSLDSYSASGSFGASLRSSPSSSYNAPDLRSAFPDSYNTPDAGYPSARTPSTSYGAPSVGFRSLPSQEYGAPSSRNALSGHAASKSLGRSKSFGASLKPRLSSSYTPPTVRNLHSKTQSFRSVSLTYGAPGQRSSGDSYANARGLSDSYSVPSARGLTDSYSAPNARGISDTYGAPNARSLSQEYGTPNAAELKTAAFAAPFGAANARSSPSEKYGAPSVAVARNAMPSEQYGVPEQYSSLSNQGYSYAAGRNADELNQEPANYDFAYKVADYETGSDFGHTESRQDNRAEGSYFVVLPDGTKQTVEYEADERGFKPRISVEPADASARAGGYDDNAHDIVSARSGNEGPY